MFYEEPKWIKLLLATYSDKNIELTGLYPMLSCVETQIS
jgi:hypothetical protein